jgi:hypothetical protein
VPTGALCQPSPRLASSRGLSTQCNTRLRWYAKTVTLHSARPFATPRLRQEP